MEVARFYMEVARFYMEVLAIQSIEPHARPCECCDSSRTGIASKGREVHIICAADAYRELARENSPNTALPEFGGV
jgi:hypothetical protein